MNTDRISVKQLRALYLVSVLSPAIRLIPNSTVLHAKSASWLSAVFALGPVLLYVLLLEAAGRRHRDGESIKDFVSRAIGKRAGKAVLLAVGLWLAFYAGFLLRVDAERMHATIYKEGSVFVFVGASLIVAYIVASGSVRALARMAEVFLPILYAVLAFSCALALVDVKTENLLPVTAQDIPGAIYGALPVTNVLAVAAYFLLFLENTEKHKDAKRIMLRGSLCIMAGVFAVLLTVTGTLSAPLANHLNNPFFVMSRNLSVFGVNERIEAVVIALWVVTDLIFTSAVIRASASALHGAIGKGTLKIFILAASVGALAGAIFCARDAFVLSKVSEYWVPLGNIFFTCVLFPVVFIIGIRRNRKGKRKQDTISGG